MHTAYRHFWDNHACRAENIGGMQNDMILFHSKDFTVINKMADLRMDGDSEVTVEKLLADMYPDSSIKWV